MNEDTNLQISTNPPLVIPDVSSSFCFIHKITGEKMRIKKIFGDVALCECENIMVITKSPYMETKAAVCSLSNLLIKKSAIPIYLNFNKTNNMTPKEFLKVIWICEPPKGAITIESVEEAMLLYGRHLTAKKWDNCPSCKGTDIYHNGSFWTCKYCTYDWNAC